MSPSAAKPAVMHVKTMHVHNGKCLPQFAPTAAEKQKFLSNPVKIVRFIVLIALQKSKNNKANPSY